MRIITKGRLCEYWERHPGARNWLQRWYSIACKAEWQDLTQVRTAFRQADPVSVGSGRTVTVFNVCGNKHRLITAIHYQSGIVFVLMLMTHADYSKKRWKDSL